MQIRLSIAARQKIKVQVAEYDGTAAENRYCEWCADLFTADRRDYFIVCNAYSLYGVCFPAKGITTAQKFTDAFISELKAALDHAGLSSLFETYIAGNNTHTTFCKTYDLHVRAGMNRLKEYITYDIESDASKEKVYDSIAGFITTTFGGVNNYSTPLELFTNDKMKLPADPQPPVIKKADLPVQAIQFSLELNDFPQKLTRRFIIKDDVKMTTLGYAILSMIKAAGGHLFTFEVTQTEFHSEFTQRVSKSPFLKNTDPTELSYDMLEASSPATIIELPDPYGDTFGNMKTIDARKIKVGKAFESPDTRCLFTYDFGDSWEFTLKAEKHITADDLSKVRPVRILEGENYGIIDDCGGTGGLEHLIATFKKHSGQEYKDLKEWLGRDTFDFSEFSVEEANECLKGDMKMYKESYEDEAW